MATINYSGQDVDFKEIFYQYAKLREGYRNQSYKDKKGLDTIGIGHLITGAEPFAIDASTVLSDDQVQQLFDMDYNRLHEEGFIQEIQNAGYTYNMMLAVAHFIWAHGYAQYNISQLRSGLLAGTFTQDSILTYLAANWDIRSPRLQKMNKEDFTIGFSSTPWVPNFHLHSQKV